MNRKQVEFSVFIPPDEMDSVICEKGFDFFIKAAQKAERLRFSAFFLPDHYMYPKNDTLYEAWTTLAALASGTKRIRIGTCVTPIPFYQPSFLAKRVSTLDHISGGRVIFGVGCGWYEKEFQAFGVSFDPFRVRIQKMLEGVELTKALWTEDDPVNYHGEYYSLKDAELLPKPLQNPHPPIWFGGSSIPILKATARHGQGWIPGVEPPQTFQEKSEFIIRHTRKEGRNPAEITVAIALRTLVAQNSNEVRRILKTLSIDEEARQKMFVGTPNQIVARIREYMEAGVSHFRLGIQPVHRFFEGLELYSEEIIPAVTK